jgi:hypothetical protein
MTTNTNTPVPSAVPVTAVPTTAEKMKTVKAAWDKAPAGMKKDNALKHYQAAEKAMTAKSGSRA